jgi:hypothetical protein
MSFVFHDCQVHIDNPINDSRLIGNWTSRNSHNNTDSNLIDSFNHAPGVERSPFSNASVTGVDTFNDAMIDRTESRLSHRRLMF